MSEETLRRLLERLHDDAAFVEHLKVNPEETLREFELSPTEQFALTSNDEDALRRLAGLDVSGYAAGLDVPDLVGSGPKWTDVLCPPSEGHFCPPPGPTYVNCPTIDLCRH
jgi:hypothetical protein